MYRFLGCMTILLLMASCRRPEVIEQRESEIIEFEFHNKSSVKNYVEPAKELRTPLTRELFDPFHIEAPEYKISRGDVLEIFMYGEDDNFVRETVVAPDGRLYYMFVDGIPAEGRTLKEVATDLSKRLAPLFINPEVTIIPRSIAAQRYCIIGKVNRQGSYPIVAALTLRQAIGEAGGISFGGYNGTTIQIASLRESFIIRNGKKLDVDFAKLVFTEGSDYDIYVQPGDYIYIASSLVKQIYLCGAVPEQHAIPYYDGITLVQAISGPSGISGGIILGTAYGSNVSQIMIVRGSLTNPQVMMVNLFKIIEGKARDVYLEPGDIVYVPDKKWRFARSLVHAAIYQFAAAFGSDAGNYYATEKWFKSGP
jgi:polysaccharide export outer membrane protein